jgi:hypothetical protein
VKVRREVSHWVPGATASNTPRSDCGYFCEEGMINIRPLIKVKAEVVVVFN